jgi:hypothetical protein
LVIIHIIHDAWSTQHKISSVYSRVIDFLTIQTITLHGRCFLYPLLAVHI